jgi:hypothetical protein
MTSSRNHPSSVTNTTEIAEESKRLVLPFFLDQLFAFPDPLTHDDLIDSLAYIDQLAKVTYAGNFEELDNFEALDSLTGY